MVLNVGNITSFNDSDFIDGAHLNYKGAKKMKKNGL
jgi:hypothetical protein